MKRITTLFSFLSLSTLFFAQGTEAWPRAGATWKYCLQNLHGGAWTQSHTFAYTSDTVINGNTYAVVRLTEVNDQPLAPDGSSWWVAEENMRTYFRQSGDTVYRYANGQDYVFTVLGIEVDESITAFRSVSDDWGVFACTDQMQLTVEAVSQTDYGGNVYREVRYKDQDPFFEGTTEFGVYTFIEEVGVKNDFPYIYEEHLSIYEDSPGETVGECIEGVTHVVQGGTLYAYQDEYVTIDFMPCAINLSAEEAQRQQAVKIYPNPAADRLFIEIPNHAGSATDVTVFDMSGRAVMKERIASAPGSIDVSVLVPGAYVAVVTLNGQSFSAKFMRF